MPSKAVSKCLLYLIPSLHCDILNMTNKSLYKMTLTNICVCKVYIVTLYFQ